MQIIGERSITKTLSFFVLTISFAYKDLAKVCAKFSGTLHSSIDVFVIQRSFGQGFLLSIKSFGQFCNFYGSSMSSW